MLINAIIITFTPKSLRRSGTLTVYRRFFSFTNEYGSSPQHRVTDVVTGREEKRSSDRVKKPRKPAEILFGTKVATFIKSPECVRKIGAWFIYIFRVQNGKEHRGGDTRIRRRKIVWKYVRIVVFLKGNALSNHSICSIRRL